ncbi:hypothetical protein Ancab_039327 [Ancistrocladus abbreviatus]
MEIEFGDWPCEEVPLISEDDSLKQPKDEWNKLILGKGFVLTNMLKSVNFELHVQEPFFSQLKDCCFLYFESQCRRHENGLRKVCCGIGSGALVLFNKCLILEVQDNHRYASFVKMLEVEALEKVLPGVLTIQEGNDFLTIWLKFFQKGVLLMS